jgi:asparagine synthase (glutamine-hydrolysing)
MPGIVGLITKRPRRDAESELTRMLDTLRHGPRYLTGTCVDEASRVYLGWSVLKNSFADGMPLRNERGNVVLVFSGEEFCEPGTAARLTRNGHAFDANGPEYLVHLAEDDETFPAGLNGRFHGLLMDQARGTRPSSTAPVGMHRVYYHESADAVYFAAEAKAILAVRRASRADPADWASC